MADACNAHSCSCCTEHEYPRGVIISRIDTPAGVIPVINTKLGISDHLGAIRARLGFNRMKYRVSPGLYAIGKPSRDSVVFVTANYKLTFDALRKQLGEIDAWILILETYGVNVWCSAGKGTFSTSKIADRIRDTGLDKVVAHRTIILPQLAAPGVAAHKLHELSGFKVIYGPVRARDIPAYLKSGMKARGEMRRVRFPFVERVKLIPLELRSAMKFAVPLLASLCALSIVAHGNVEWRELLWLLIPIFFAFILGAAIVPALLPWIPFRSFVIKGAVVGILWAGIISVIHDGGWMWKLGNVLLLPAIAAFYALTFTGSTTYTSQSGVNREIRLYARPMAIVGICGLVCIIASLFIR